MDSITWDAGGIKLGNMNARAPREQAPRAPRAMMTPMMVHYLETKKKCPDCILFYRLGDFYEMFFDDA